MEEALRHICHGSHHASSSANVTTTHSTEKQPTGHTTLTPISEQPSTMAADPVKDHITLDYERFRSHTAGDDNIGQLVRQAVDNTDLYRGFLLHQVYRKVQDEFEPLVREAIDIKQEYENAAMQIMDLMACQADHKQKMRELQERFSNATRRAIEEIPTEPFYHRYPDVFNRRPAALIAEETRHTLNNHLKPSFYPNLDRRHTPPIRQYDASNPRWSGQNAHGIVHPDTKKIEYFSNWKPRSEYKWRQCDFCRLYGHIQWNCPQYACPHCNRACGHTPSKCPKKPSNSDGRDPQIRRVEIDSRTIHALNQGKIKKVTKTTTIPQPNVGRTRSNTQTAIRGIGRPPASMNTNHPNTPNTRGRAMPYMRMTTCPHYRRPPPPPSQQPPAYEENNDDFYNGYYNDINYNENRSD